MIITANRKRYEVPISSLEKKNAKVEISLKESHFTKAETAIQYANVLWVYVL